MYDMMETPPLFTLFGKGVTPYALFVTLGALLGVVMACRRAPRAGTSRSAALTFAVLGIPLAVIAGRAVFCLGHPVNVMDFGFQYVFRIDYGGFSLIGVTLGLALAAYLTHLIEKTPFLAVLDAVVPGCLMALALARLGEGSTMNGTGPEVTVAALCFAPVARQGLYGEYTYAVHMGEAVTALCASLYTQGLDGKARGYAAGMGVILVAAAQIVWESARRDEVMRFDFVRYGMVFAALVLLAVLLCALRRAPWKRCVKALCVAGLFLLAGAAAAFEFFIDGKFIQEIPIWACYLCDCVFVTGMAALCVSALRAACRKV